MRSDPAGQMVTSEKSFKYEKEYLRSHVRHPKWWAGRMHPDGADAIADLVRRTDARRLLDYGSGKGYQYLADRVHERWGGILPHCFDVGVWHLRRRPEGEFDGLICTDVMEHIAECDIDDVLDDALGFLRRDALVFAYFNVFCNLSGRNWREGKNVHLTVRPPEWWDRKIAQRVPGNTLLWIDYEYVRDHDM